MYNRIFNAMAILTLVGLIFIGCTIPVLARESKPEEPALKARILAPDINVTLPDVSFAFVVEANREKALSVMESVEIIQTAINSVEPELLIPPKLTYIGSFYVTFYAATVEQCGNDLGITASGKKVTEDPTCWTVAVDPKVIPLGTKLKIDLDGYEDIVFEATDTGSAIKGNDVDVFTSSEPLSKSWNPCYADVWIVEEE